MAREVISAEALLRLVNAQFARIEDCRNLEATAITLAPERPQGANWLVTGIRRSGNDSDKIACQAVAETFLQTLQDMYDMES
jgi:hypothetical protein